MKTYLFFLMSITVLLYLLYTFRRKPSFDYRTVDVVLPAFNEEPIIRDSVLRLMANPYIRKVIVVNDGSTDGTARVLNEMTFTHRGSLRVVHQSNTGKGGALMAGLKHVDAPYVFLTDADTRVPNDNSLGYMVAELQNGADAVGGIPSSDLNGAGVLPYIRATVKLPMIVMKRTFQQLIGGAPFIISGACGMFKTEVLRKHGFSDRTKVEDLDLTWTLVREGYKIRQANRCVVYPQECNTVKEEWRRWRRWIVGYAVCMRLHRDLLLSRFGILCMMPMVGVVFLGIFFYSVNWTATAIKHGLPIGIVYALFPLAWVAVVSVIGGISAVFHRKWVLLPLASISVLYVLLAYAVWLVHGIKGLLTGKEPQRDKPTRYVG